MRETHKNGYNNKSLQQELDYYFRDYSKKTSSKKLREKEQLKKDVANK